MTIAKVFFSLSAILLLDGRTAHANDHSISISDFSDPKEYEKAKVLISEEEDKSLHTRGSPGGNTFKLLSVAQLSSDQATVTPLNELGSEHAIGSVTRICPDARWLPANNLERAQKYEWYLTAAHMLGPELKGVATLGSKLDIAMRDDRADLAVLRRPIPPQSSTEPLPCYQLADAVSLATLYDVNTVMDPNFDRSLMFETIDRKLKGARLIANRAYAGYSVESGVPGRENTGKLILAGAAGFRGQSGGALCAWMREKHVVDFPLLSNDRAPKLIGLILNFAPDGHQVAALPSPTILALLKRHFSRASAILGDASHQPYLRSSVAGGTRIEDTPFIALRGSPDAGTGGQNDGGTHLDAKGHLPRTGIWDSKQHVRYLAFGRDVWSENEAIPQSIIQDLKAGVTKFSIFEKDGKIFVRGGLEALPRLVDANSPGYTRLKRLPNEKADCAFSRGTYQMRRELSAEDHAPPGTTHGAIAAESAHFVCEESTPTGRRWMIKSFVEPAYNDLVKGATPSLEGLKGAALFTVEWKLKPLRAGGDCARELCELEIHAPPGFKADGLRSYANDTIHFTINRKGGFEIDVTDPLHLQTMRFSGPSLAPGIKSFTEDLMRGNEAPRVDQVWKARTP